MSSQERKNKGVKKQDTTSTVSPDKKSASPQSPKTLQRVRPKLDIAITNLVQKDSSSPLLKQSINNKPSLDMEHSPLLRKTAKKELQRTMTHKQLN